MEAWTFSIANKIPNQWQVYLECQNPATLVQELQFSKTDFRSKASLGAPSASRLADGNGCAKEVCVFDINEFSQS